ncbi:MAG: hypothetical protein AAGC78_19150 [Cellvibrio sp.]|uniref:hypothetical protein n=1 Tax=Cellvibrio sp. TaxID=1965322 RepID=UPI0031B28C6F
MLIDEATDDAAAELTTTSAALAIDEASVAITTSAELGVLETDEDSIAALGVAISLAADDEDFAGGGVLAADDLLADDEDATTDERESGLIAKSTLPNLIAASDEDTFAGMGCACTGIGKIAVTKTVRATKTIKAIVAN